MNAVKLVISSDGRDSLSASRHFLVVFIFGSRRRFKVFRTKGDCFLSAQRRLKRANKKAHCKRKHRIIRGAIVWICVG